MPWKNITSMEEIIRFVMLAQTDRFTITELCIEYQLRARALRRDGRVAVAAYGDDGLWYVPTKAEYPMGGYEVSAAFCGDDVDASMTATIENLLEVESAPARR